MERRGTDFATLKYAFLANWFFCVTPVYERLLKDKTYSNLEKFKVK